MKRAQLKKAIETVAEIAKECPYDAIRKAEVVFKGWLRFDFLSNRTNTIRVAIFQKGRTSIIINYSDKPNKPNLVNTPEVVKTTNKNDYRDYMNKVEQAAM